ncbi:unnamed protein product [Zymoseptoria tritici ST99CH_1A5]|uniref:CrcB-like protein n=3 Tax=Zymoseptoria tritici TaxID=1047171 RepID=F9XQR4_ZYMTI|nr:uncharacterized protein MYCGRDRAFT_101931 [Zymoseptoria tritici IPO323]EGP82402.1 hypothetical protein MYCGRDRAFT_101931 [Zymoseptoria tritici IPO323]SMR62279.1 unnamed protein product [Zymoseptoria tritici ST99CH_1E4]SMY30111.1 unnamed protein product [Zymoseptoria tritici ST99CH_1A5]
MPDHESELAREESGLDELAAPAPDENPNEQGFYQHESLESHRRQTKEQIETEQEQQPAPSRTSQWLTQLYIFSYLIFFSIFGVLARTGLQALTVYPGALIANTDLWANIGGSFTMGMLREDRMLFRRHWKQEMEKARREASSSSDDPVAEKNDKDLEDTARKSFTSTKGGIPAYVGLTVGFCGSFTSFASICRDAFLAISNNLNTAVVSTQDTISLPRARPTGDSVMAVLALLILEVGLSTVALTCGAHLGAALARPAEHIPALKLSRIMNPLVVFLGFGCWLGAILLTIWPIRDAWRGQVLFSLVFAPLGCLLRFQLSVRMNKLVRSFPLGTFAANVFGTCVLGMAYDLQMSSAASSIVSCQVLQGIMDGFCGALTTVSTWVLELDTLRLRHAYFYGACSLFIGVGFITAIMGSLRWTTGFTAPTCKT